MNSINQKFNVPEGMRDLIFEDCRRHSEIGQRLAAVYEGLGFREASTPTLEFLDVFEGGQNAGSGERGCERMYKLTDCSGRLLALRADNTLPIARVAATKLTGELPALIYYNQSVFAMQSENSGRRGEITQSGVELIGAGAPRGDMLCVLTAARALQSLGLPFKLELGHVGFSRALMGELELSETQKRSLRRLVNAKNAVSLGAFNGLGKTESDRIRRLPLLYGGSEIFAEAEALAGGNKRASDALDNLKTLYTRLAEAGLAEHVILDLGIVHELDYYTGAVLRGYIEGIGEPILSGGRYDGLLSGFGYDIPATGFAINVGAVADRMAKTGCRGDYPPPDALIHYSEEKFAEAAALAQKFAREGRSCELSCFSELEDSKRYAASRNIAEVISL